MVELATGSIRVKVDEGVRNGAYITGAATAAFHTDPVSVLREAFLRAPLIGLDHVALYISELLLQVREVEVGGLLAHLRKV